jgi:toxin ParE1/3/4
MKYGLIVLPAASDDVRDIAQMIACDSLETALRFVDAVSFSYAEVQSTPLAREKVDAKALEMKRFHKRGVKGFRNFLIFYRVDGEMVYIVRVFHGSRDIVGILKQELRED